MKTQIQISAIMMFRFIDCGLHATMFFASDCNLVQQPFNDKARQATIEFGTLTAPLIRMGNCCVKYQEWEVIYWPDKQKHYNRNEDKGKDKENDNDTLKEQSWSSLYKYKLFHLSEVWGSKGANGHLSVPLWKCFPTTDPWIGKHCYYFLNFLKYCFSLWKCLLNKVIDPPIEKKTLVCLTDIISGRPPEVNPKGCS